MAAPITPTTTSSAAIDCTCISNATLNAAAIPATAIAIAAAAAIAIAAAAATVTTAAGIRAAGIACAATATSAVPQDHVSTLSPRIRPSTAGSIRRVQRELCISRRLGSGYWGRVALTRRQPVPKLSLRPVTPLLVILRQ
jgi:hypothetical protein